MLSYQSLLWSRIITVRRSHHPGYCSRYQSLNNIVIVPTVEYTKNTHTPLTHLQEMNVPADQSIERNIAKIMGLPYTKPTLLEDVPADQSVERNIAKIMGLPYIKPTLLEEQTKPTFRTENQKKPTPSLNQIESKSRELLKPSLERQIKPRKLLNEDVNENLANIDDLNQSKKVNSWASNYLQSIGHNNIKPIKLTLSTARNKLQRIETIETMSSDSNKAFAQPAVLRDATSSCEVFNMPDNSIEEKLIENLTCQHINDSNIKTLHPMNVKPVVHPTIAPDLSLSGYKNNNNKSNAPHHVSLNTKGIGETAYCYNDGKQREMDILDAIKSKIARESVIEQKSRMMNLPTHKDMCEKFIMEISSNKPSSESKHVNLKLTAANKEKVHHNKKNKTTKPDKNAKSSGKNEKKSLNTIKKKTSAAEKSKKLKSAVIKDKVVTEEKKKQQILITKLVDPEDSDVTKHVFVKRAETQTKTENPERRKLKRVRTNSEDKHDNISETHTRSPNRTIQVAESILSNSPKRLCRNESFDLRSKLGRKHKIHRKQKEADLYKNTKPKQRDNLKITVENYNDEKQKSPKKSSVLKYKTKKCKKLKLIINVVCQESDNETTSSDSSFNESTPTHNIDLSFLDDINVDEIVDSLKHSPNKHKIKSPLPHETKKEELASAEPELQLAKLFNILQATSETCKPKTLPKTECKIEESTKIDSLPYINILNSVSNVATCSKSEEKANKINSAENTKTSPTLLHLNQQNLGTTNKISLDLNSIQTKESNVVITNSSEKEQSFDTEKLITDESVIIIEQEVSTIDLADDTVEKINKDAIITQPIPSEKLDKEVKLVNEKTIQELLDSENAKTTTEYTLGNDSKTVLLDDGAVNHKSANTQMDIETENMIKQESNTDQSKKDKELVKTETQINCNEKNIVLCSDIKFKEKQKIAVENSSTTVTGNSNSIAGETKPVEITVKDVKATVHKETCIKTKEVNPKESVHSVSKIKESTSTNKSVTKTLETKATKKVLKETVENVCETRTELQNTSKTNDIKPEPIIASKTNTIVNKEKDASPLVEKHKTLAELLKERILGYLNKHIKVIEHIHLGKYSNIYSCKGSNGETYAAKVLTDQTAVRLKIQKEQMLRQIQQDIPRENLNTIYLIDGFGVQRYWCFLTDYYPKNLAQALGKLNRPFHIERVQNLARQLISAIMVLRNNDIIHSDIKPTHILLNEANNRLKLCGFDGAFYGSDDVCRLPSIGTSCYRAPEIILGFSVDYSIDVWSSALVIYQMATNQKLFSGRYNNDILYQQLCTFGNIPQNMMEASLYTHQHFRARTFLRQVSYRRQEAVFFNKFHKTKLLQKSIYYAYYNYWQSKDAYKWDSDMYKLTALHRLLEQMLQLDPRLRLAVEFVCADPFIYEMFW